MTDETEAAAETAPALTALTVATRGGDVDALDGSLIRALQQNGRASIHDLARDLAVSRDVVSQRLRVLIGRDRLRVVAALDPGFVGQHLLVHAMVVVDGPARPVAERIAGMPEAVFVSLVSGGIPLVFESRHGDTAGLHATLAAVRAIPAVRRVRVTTYDEVLKGFFVARSRRDVTLDAIDRDLIAVLQDDGRASFRSLAIAVHLSPSSARARVHRLIDAGVIRISAIKSGGLSRNRVAIGLGIAVRGDTEPVRRHIVASPAVDFAARSHGVYDFVATIVGTTAADVVAVIEGVRALGDVGTVDTWTHLDLIKEDYTRTLGPAALPSP